MLNNSEDDDILKDLVSKTLQNNGVLGKIQAQLRASVFLALEEEFKDRSIPLCNKKSEELLSSPAGGLAASLMQDFLSSLGLDFTSSVFGPESRLTGGLWKIQSRDQMAQKLGIETSKDANTPILLTYCQQLLKDGVPKNPKINDNSVSTAKHPSEKDSSSLLKGFPPLTPMNNSSNKILEPISTDTKKKDDPLNKNTSGKLSNNNLHSDKSSLISNLTSVKTSDASSESRSTSMTKMTDSVGNRESTSNSDLKEGKLNERPNRLPPSNILSEPPVIEDWEDSSESMSYDNVNRKQLIKTLISEVENERTNKGGTKKDEFSEKTDSEGGEESSSVAKSVSEEVEESICTDEDVSFGDIISEGSQKTNETEDQTFKSASNAADFSEDL